MLACLKRFQQDLTQLESLLFGFAEDLMIVFGFQELLGFRIKQSAHIVRSYRIFLNVLTRDVFYNIVRALLDKLNLDLESLVSLTL